MYRFWISLQALHLLKITERTNLTEEPRLLQIFFVILSSLPQIREQMSGPEIS